MDHRYQKKLVEIQKLSEELNNLVRELELFFLILSNLSKGASAINVKLTKKERKISTIIAKDLKKSKIFFAGIDFIDQKINGDINVTSPTGLKTYHDLSKINLAKTFWKELKA